MIRLVEDRSFVPGSCDFLFFSFSPKDFKVSNVFATMHKKRDGKCTVVDLKGRKKEWIQGWKKKRGEDGFSDRRQKEGERNEVYSPENKQ